MTIIIDGHNLIPHMPGLSLRQPDDEQRLIAWLQAYSRQKHKHIEVYFDRAAFGHAGKHNFGSVSAYFVQPGMIADEAIRRRLERLGKEAGNWTVVSSDHQVQAEAHSRHARVISSEQFALELANLERSKGDSAIAPSGLTPSELSAWLEIFGQSDDGDKSD
ncbi:MAG: NYN domain-containing protein [Anaerolineaceae bacterium]|nr:NYN domain-containing protein [Anaerolineaceae bacterium]